MTVSKGPPICPCFTLTKARTPPPDASSSIESWLRPTLPPGTTSEKYRSWPASSEAEPNPGGTVWTPSKSTRRAGKMSSLLHLLLGAEALPQDCLLQLPRSGAKTWRISLPLLCPEHGSLQEVYVQQTQQDALGQFYRPNSLDYAPCSS
jgi:hypothetical protein